MSEHIAHAYYKMHPRDFGNEYTVLSVPVGEEDDEEMHQDGWTRIPRDKALRDARWTRDNNAQPKPYVRVDPCPCGTCALTQYAEEHPYSALGNRVRDAEWQRSRRGGYRAHETPEVA